MSRDPADAAAPGPSSAREGPLAHVAGRWASFQRRWEENASDGRRLRVAYRVAGETALAGAVAFTAGYLKGIPRPRAYTGRGLALGFGWALYYNGVQEILRAQRDRDDWINSLGAGALVGFSIGVPYAGVRRAPAMMLQFAGLAVAGRVLGRVLGLGDGFVSLLVRAELLDRAPVNAHNKARTLEWWQTLPGARVLGDGEKEALQRTGRAHLIRPLTHPHALAQPDAWPGPGARGDGRAGGAKALEHVTRAATVEELLEGLPEAPGEGPGGRGPGAGAARVR